MTNKTRIGVGKKSEAAVHTVIVRTIIGTTWRMVVPTIGGTLSGLGLDSIYGTKPWLMLSGVAFGFALAFMLVWLQIRQLKPKGVTK